MLFHRATHHADGTPKAFPPEATRIWRSTAAGLVGHMMDDRWMSLDQILTSLRDYEAANPTDGPVEMPAAPLADVLQGLSDLTATFMVEAVDRPVAGHTAVTFSRSVPAGDSGIRLHPLARDLLTLVDREDLLAEALRARVIRAYPDHACPTISETLKGLADLLRHGLVVAEEVPPSKDA